MSDRLCSRLEKLHEHIVAGGLEGVILTPGPNVKYYTGVNAPLYERPHLLFVPREGDAHVVVPVFEAGPYTRISPKIILHAWNDAEGPTQAFQTVSSELGLSGKWGVEGRVPYRFIHLLRKHAAVEFEDAEPILQGIREIKDSDEIRSLQHAASILSKAYLKIPNQIKPGVTEIELANRMTKEIYSNGAEHVDEVLVQTGVSAADPHHTAQAKKIQRGESIVIDATCTYAGYYADITRTFTIGTNPNFQRIYQSVLEAQKEAIGKSKKDSTTGNVDEAARGRLRKDNLESYFTHRTGHGLGMEVHEAPYILPNGNEKIQPGMVFTIEPGVYIAGKIGVRIEDDVLITEDGAKVLTKALPKELGWWRR